VSTGRPVLRVGDQVAFEERSWTVAGLDGARVRLVDEVGGAQVLLLTQLLTAPGFRSLAVAPGRQRLDPLGLLEALPAAVLERALDWERHVVEVHSGLPPGSDPGTRPREPYDPGTYTLEERDTAKAAELSAAGRHVSMFTVRRMRLRYQAEGLWGLVDHRATRRSAPYGRVDERVVAAVAAAMEQETTRSTGTRLRLRRDVEHQLAVEHGAGVVPLPSRATFYRLLTAMDNGGHTFGEATTRRSQAGRPARPFTRTTAVRPGELVQIDTSPLDILAQLDDGVSGRVELTIVLDVSTRSICAALLRPKGTKAIDAALLLARMLVPEPMRPGWPDALRMGASQIPHQRLLPLDARLDQAAARPVIVPETVITDRGSVFVSETFVRACARLGISVAPARPRTPTDKGIVERSFRSIGTLFSQHVAGYLGPNVTRRGTGEATEAHWSLAQLQELLDEWIITGWQSRPHAGLRDPQAGGRQLSPNEMFAAAITAAGHVTMPLTGDDYLELLPVVWRTIGDHGIQIDYRTYDSPSLNRYRHTTSGVAGKGRQWEIHHDPYDLSHVFIRDTRRGGWIAATWTHLPMVGRPFADFTWRAARQIAAERGTDTTDQTAVARALDDLLTRSSQAPSRPRRAAARNRAAASSRVPTSEEAEVPIGPADESTLSAGGDPTNQRTEPFGVFEAGDDRRYR
jgi:transposase InsO family protein